jgi:UDP-N-acetylmuramoyl-tripeptide--D-alanyl-D-alanine ligase
MGIPRHVTEAALREFKRPEGRLNRLDLPGMTVIDDTYNANPLSMHLGLDTLAEIAEPGQRRVAILGHMSELGDEAARYHQELGAYARTRADVLVGVGELSRHYASDAWFDSSDACADQIESVICFGDWVLVKGSASARMRSVVEKLREIAQKRHGAPI